VHFFGNEEDGEDNKVGKSKTLFCFLNEIKMKLITLNYGKKQAMCSIKFGYNDKFVSFT